MADDVRMYGTVALTRALVAHALWENEEAFDRRSAFIDLLLGANTAPREWRNERGDVLRLARGQLYRSALKLAARWRWGREKVAGYLRDLARLGVIRLDVDKRGFLITFVNYDTYNPPPSDIPPGKLPDKSAVKPSDIPPGKLPDKSAVKPSDIPPGKLPDTEYRVPSIPSTEGGDPKAPAGGDSGFVAVPSEDEVLAFAQAYPGNLAKGVPGPIPTCWVTSWFAWALGQREFPLRWQAILKLRFEADWLDGHPKARPDAKKMGDEKSSGATPAQTRFLVSRELDAIRERLDAAYEVGIQLDAGDVARAKELEAQLEGMK